MEENECLQLWCCALCVNNFTTLTADPLNISFRSKESVLEILIKIYNLLTLEHSFHLSPLGCCCCCCVPSRNICCCAIQFIQRVICIFHCNQIEEIHSSRIFIIILLSVRCSHLYVKNEVVIIFRNALISTLVESRLR